MFLYLFWLTKTKGMYPTASLTSLQELCIFVVLNVNSFSSKALMGLQCVGHTKVTEVQYSSFANLHTGPITVCQIVRESYKNWEMQAPESAVRKRVSAAVRQSNRHFVWSIPIQKDFSPVWRNTAVSFERGHYIDTAYGAKTEGSSKKVKTGSTFFHNTMLCHLARFCGG